MDQNETRDGEPISEHVDALEGLMRRTWRAWMAPVLFEGALWYLATLGAVALSALIFAALAPPSATAAVPWILALGGGAATIGALAAWGAHRMRQPDPASIARVLQRHASVLREDISSALAYGHAIEDGTFETGMSVQLATLHIERTASRAEDLSRDGTLVHLLPERTTTPAAVALAGCVALLLIPALAAPEWTWRTLMGDLEKVVVEQMNALNQRTLVRNISLTFEFPSYADMPTRQEPFSTGYIEAMSGTEVTLEAYPLIDGFTSIDVVFSHSGDERIIPMELHATGRLSATLVVTEDGSYTFRANMPDEQVFTDPGKRMVKMIPDGVPTVEMISHRGELEVSPQDVLEIEFSMADDFGLTGLKRAHTFMGVSDEEAQRTVLPLEVLQTTPREHLDSFELDLTTLGMQPGDRVTLWLEATDNNTLTGPSVGKSEPLTLVVSSPQDKHYKNVLAQQEVLEMLLTSLGDYLEAPVGERQAQEDGSYIQLVLPDETDAKRSQRAIAFKKAHDGEQPALERMAQLIPVLEADPLMKPRDLSMLIALHGQLDELHDTGQLLLERLSDGMLVGLIEPEPLRPLARHAGKTEAALEKALLQFDALLVSQKMDSIKDAADEIRDLKERLKDLLQKYKETQDPELKAAIRREIQRLRQRMNELMSRMSEQMKNLPNEHVNMDALQKKQLESDSNKLKDNFKSIEELLEQNDIDGALEALERMAENLDNLTQEMDQQFDAARPQQLSEFDKEISELMDEVNDLANMQQEVERETAEMREQLREQQKKEVDEMLDEFTKEMLQRVDKQKKALDELDPSSLPEYLRQSTERARRQLDDLEANLKQQDIETSVEHARESLDELQDVGESIRRSMRYTPQNSPRGKTMRRMDRQLGPMTQRGQGMLDDLQELMDEAQQMREGQGKQQMQGLSGKQGQVNERAQQLRQRLDQASEKYPALEQQLKPSMQKAQEAMQQAKDGLERGRVQRALDEERQALEQLRQMKQQMKQSLQQQREGDKDGKGKQSRQKVAIPGKGDARRAPGYRDALQDAMKEERLRDYATEIEEYYKSLVE